MSGHPPGLFNARTSVFVPLKGILPTSNKYAWLVKQISPTISMQTKSFVIPDESDNGEITFLVLFGDPEDESLNLRTIRV